MELQSVLIAMVDTKIKEQFDNIILNLLPRKNNKPLFLIRFHYTLYVYVLFIALSSHW